MGIEKCNSGNETLELQNLGSNFEKFSDQSISVTRTEEDGGVGGFDLSCFL
uniref:Uncharacterized protein n=1 Tax=Cucumis melo TaxID=3656 RepID=A0A9I9CY53_CUCME